MVMKTTGWYLPSTSVAAPSGASITSVYAYPTLRCLDTRMYIHIITDLTFLMALERHRPQILICDFLRSDS